MSQDHVSESDDRQFLLSVFAEPLREYLLSLEALEEEESFNGALLVMAKYLIGRAKKDSDLLLATHSDVIAALQLEFASPFLGASVAAVCVDLTLEGVQAGGIDEPEAVITGLLTTAAPVLEKQMGRWHDGLRNPSDAGHCPVAVGGALRRLVWAAAKAPGFQSWGQRYAVADSVAAMSEWYMTALDQEDQAGFITNIGSLLRGLDGAAAAAEFELTFVGPTPAEDIAARLLDSERESQLAVGDESTESLSEAVGKHGLLGVSAETAATVRSQTSVLGWARIVRGLTGWLLAGDDTAPDKDKLVTTAQVASTLFGEPPYAGAFAPRLDTAVWGLLAWSSATALNNGMVDDAFLDEEDLAEALQSALSLGRNWRWLGLPRERQAAPEDPGVETLPECWSAAICGGVVYGACRSEPVSRKWAQFFLDLGEYILGNAGPERHFDEHQRGLFVNFISEIAQKTHEDPQLKDRLLQLKVKLANREDLAAARAEAASDLNNTTERIRAERTDAWQRVIQVQDEHWTSTEDGHVFATTWEGVSEMENALDDLPEYELQDPEVRAAVAERRKVMEEAKRRHYEGGFAVPIGTALFGLMLLMAGGGCASTLSTGWGVLTALLGFFYIGCSPLYVFAARTQGYRRNRRILAGEEGGGAFLRHMMTSDKGSFGEVVMGFLMGMCCLGLFAPIVVGFHLVRNYLFK